jgi:hypothetical protein
VVRLAPLRMLTVIMRTRGSNTDRTTLESPFRIPSNSVVTTDMIAADSCAVPEDAA